MPHDFLRCDECDEPCEYLQETCKKCGRKLTWERSIDTETTDV